MPLTAGSLIRDCCTSQSFHDKANMLTAFFILHVICELEVQDCTTKSSQKRPSDKVDLVVPCVSLGRMGPDPGWSSLQEPGQGCTCMLAGGYIAITTLSTTTCSGHLTERSCTRCERYIYAYKSSLAFSIARTASKRFSAEKHLHLIDIPSHAKTPRVEQSSAQPTDNLSPKVCCFATQV